ncbi:uroporphyrinogen-III synthase [Teichococcus vastitatis]|uniref:Uroporphyrinogen-III synthase n=1 Tax=Teichococcus vastitatis TaxID=2307076 RepID=A0ABS9W438_9PROT|nr:uroporphyrinogen-III synthase [Pseudoroseomonas vastitatis]MCI0753977.1 uroporphyrinogen-III synthase [Pseudoroseomonas vastitatis]
MPPRGVLITRPEPGCAETAAAVAALGWQPVLAPALRLQSLPLALPAGLAPQAVLLPSRAAARALASTAATAWPVLAVGSGTAAEARRAGFAAVDEAEGDAASLAGLAARRLDPRKGALLLAVGRGYSVALVAALRERGFTVWRRVVYAARPAAALPDSAVAALHAGGVRAALFLSPRSARIAQHLLRQAGLIENLRDIEALALSTRIAAALADMPWKAIRATAKPDFPALLALLGPTPGKPNGRPDSEGQE